MVASEGLPDAARGDVASCRGERRAAVRKSRPPARYRRPANARLDVAAITAEYPAHLIERVRLSDGRAMTIRPICPADAERERRFVRELSAETKRFRFMHAMKELTPKMLARFTRID